MIVSRALQVFLATTSVGHEIILLENFSHPNTNVLSVRRVRGCYRLYGFYCAF